MPHFYDQEKDQAPCEEPKPTQEDAVAPAKPVPTRHNRWRSLVVPVTAIAAIGALALYPAIHGSNANGPDNSKTAGKPSRPSGTTGGAVVQAPREPSNFFGENCISQTHTIKLGETVFSLSAAGLREDPEFMDAVFAWNLSYVHEQAKKNKALANLNDLSIGTKVKIYGDCISYEPVWKSYIYNPNNPNAQPTLGNVRELVYQNYQGTDGKTHHSVTVDYQSSPRGELLRVEDCEPSPGCFDYVAGAPSHPPQDFYP